jgi:pimeloyl-ACP methyl ester carboxylesterase
MLRYRWIDRLMPFYESSLGTLHYTVSPRTAVSAETNGRPPLLLIAGAGGSLLHWPPQLRYLPGATLYALDLPGHGRSTGQGSNRIEAYVEVIHEFAVGLGLAGFVVAGHSMGGAIALAYMRTYPEQLAGAILVATGGRLRVHPDLLAALPDDFERACQQIIEWSYASAADPQMIALALQQFREVDPRLLLGDLLACNQFNMMADLEQLHLPALIICGAEDRMTPPRYSEFLHAHLPDSRLQLVEKAGHMVQLEQPTVVSTLIAEFLDELSAQ